MTTKKLCNMYSAVLQAFLKPVGDTPPSRQGPPWAPGWASRQCPRARTLASRSSVRLVRASACRSRRWKSLGAIIAGEKKRRHRKLVTAMNGTF